MTIRDHITEELGCYLLPMLKWVTLLHKYKLCKICPVDGCRYLTLDFTFQKLSSYLFVHWMRQEERHHYVRSRKLLESEQTVRKNRYPSGKHIELIILRLIIEFQLVTHLIM